MSIETELADIKSDIKNIETTLVTIQLDVARIQVETRLKTSLYGFLGGAFPALGVAIYFLLSKF